MNISSVISSTETNKLSKSPKITGLYNLVNDFCSLAFDFGVQIKPFSTKALKRLESLDAVAIEKIFLSFKNYYDVCVDASKKKIDLKDTKDFVNAGLSRMGLKTADTFYNTIAPDDLVEVYDLSHRQIFRNLRFYEVTGYSLGDLLTFEWPELYYRPSMTTGQIFKSIETVLEIGDFETHPMNVPSHFIKEINAEPLLTCEVNFKVMAPIFNSEYKKHGYVVSCSAQHIDAKTGQALDFI
jgi:hypothetical protein